MLHILFYCSESNTFHIEEIYFNTIQKGGGKHFAPILTGLHVCKLHVHEITETFMECTNNRDCLYISGFNMQRCDTFFHEVHNQKLEISGFLTSTAN